MENFQSDLSGRTDLTVQVKSGMSIDSHLERCLLVQTAELYSPGKYVNWNLSFFNGKPMIAMENFQSDLSGRTGTVQVKSGIDSHVKVSFGPNGRAVLKNSPWEIAIFWSIAI